MGWEESLEIDKEVREYTRERKAGRGRPRKSDEPVIRTERTITEIGNAVEITGVIGFGADGSTVVNPMAKESGEKVRVLFNVSKKVGLEIHNCSDSLTLTIPVRYWAQNTTGVYSSYNETLSLQPGGTEIIEEKDFILWALKSHNTAETVRFSNWLVKRSSMGSSWKRSVSHGKQKEAPDFSEPSAFTLEHANWYTTCPTTASKTRAHDSEFKKPCASLVNGVWVVKDRYKKYFGFLETLVFNSGIAPRRIHTVQSRIAEMIRQEFEAK